MRCIRFRVHIIHQTKNRAAFVYSLLLPSSKQTHPRPPHPPMPQPAVMSPAPNCGPNHHPFPLPSHLSPWQPPPQSTPLPLPNPPPSATTRRHGSLAPAGTFAPSLPLPAAVAPSPYCPSRRGQVHLEEVGKINESSWIVR